MLDSFIVFFVNYGYFAVFGVLLLCGFGLPVPEDITLVAAGFISSLTCSSVGSFWSVLGVCDQVHVMFVVSVAGVLIGDSTMFFIGKFYGKKVITAPLLSRFITPERYLWAQNKFEKHGTIFIFFARFMPGLRSPIFIVTGATHKVSYLKFLLTDGFATLISVPFWIYLGFWAERKLTDVAQLEKYVRRSQVGIFVVIGISALLIALVWFVKKKIKEKTKFFE